jgi:PAS domain S-box-containing protein
VKEIYHIRRREVRLHRDRCLVLVGVGRQPACGRSMDPVHQVTCSQFSNPMGTMKGMMPLYVEQNVRLEWVDSQQTLRIPRELKLDGDEVLIRKEGNRLIIEPVDNGSLPAVLATPEPVKDEFCTDGSERYRLNQEQEKGLALLDSLFQSSPVGLGFWDRDLRFIRLNQALATINGLPPEAHIGKRPTELLPTLDSIQEIEAVWQGILETGVPVLNTEVTGSTPAAPYEHRTWREHWFPVHLHGEVIGIGAVVEDITALKQAEAERERLLRLLIVEQARLAELNEQLEERVTERTNEVRHLAGQLAVAEQTERQRVSQVLHDNIQQMLYGLQMRAHLLTMDLSPEGVPALQEHMTAIRTLIEDAIAVTRNLSHSMNPPILETSDIGALIRWLVYHMQELHGLHTTVTVQGVPQSEDKSCRILLFNAVRELLFNVVKHAGVREAEMEVVAGNGILQLSIRDRGQGFDPSMLSTDNDNRQGIGLFNIRERLRLLGGEMHIQSTPGQGTEVTLLVQFKS